MTQPRTCDVVVVGYGPTGLAATSLLSRLGHDVVAFERWPSLYGLPRLVNLDAEAARIVQASGDIEVALEESTPFERYYFRNAAGDTLVDMDWSGRHHCGYAAHLSMYQPHVEDAIDAAARERGADVRQGSEVIGFEQDDDGVTITARNQDGADEVVRAAWVIAADGAGSTIRELLGVHREDLGMRSAFLNLDTMRKDGMAPKYMNAPTVTCAPPRMHVVVPIGASRLRFELEVNEDDDPEELLKPETAWKMLREWHDLGPEDVEIYRQVIYEFDSKLADKWRHGRVLLAGDAAHLMPPFLGQGACSGLRDAINLSWRLDVILRGIVGPELLDSYEAERSPHVQTQILTSVGMGHMATESRPAEAKARDDAFLSGNAPPPPPDAVVSAGIIHRDADGEPLRPAGELGPQGVIELDGKRGRADDLTGWGFRLICDGMDPLSELGDDHHATLERLGVEVLAISGDLISSMPRDIEGHYREYFDGVGIQAVLVRPDFVVFGAAHSPAEVGELIDDLGGQLPAPS
jgi:3-(3-hydroxy-phenyl)propionate hydroxylase